MNDFSNFLPGDHVIVSEMVTGHEFSAIFNMAYDEDSTKFGLAVVIDQDNDAFDVEPDDIRLDERDDEHDQFLTDAEADQDALDSAYGPSDDDCTCLGDE